MAPRALRHPFLPRVSPPLPCVFPPGMPAVPPAPPPPTPPPPQANQATLNAILEELVDTTYFRLFRVDLSSDLCPFWKQNPEVPCSGEATSSRGGGGGGGCGRGGAARGGAGQCVCV